MVCAAISIGDRPWSALGIVDASLNAYVERSDTKAELSAGTIVAISSEVRPMLGKTNERKKRVRRTMPSSL